MNGDYDYLFDGHASPFTLSSEVRVVLVGGSGDDELAADLGNTLEAAFSSHQPSCFQSIDASGVRRGPRPLQLRYHLHYDVKAYGQSSEVAQAVQGAIRAGAGNGRVIDADKVERELDSLVVKGKGGASHTIFVLDTGSQEVEYSYALPGADAPAETRTQRWISRQGYVVIDLRACSGGDASGAASGSCRGGTRAGRQPTALAVSPVDETIPFHRAPNPEKARSKADGHM